MARASLRVAARPHWICRQVSAETGIVQPGVESPLWQQVVRLTSPGVQSVFVVFRTLVVFTPKALHSEAQGREAWRAHPGFRLMRIRVPQRGSTIRVHCKNRSRLVEPRWGSWLYFSTTQGALTPFATLGFGVQRLRRRNCSVNEALARRLGARIGRFCRNLLPRPVTCPTRA